MQMEFVVLKFTTIIEAKKIGIGKDTILPMPFYFRITILFTHFLHTLYPVHRGTLPLSVMP